MSKNSEMEPLICDFGKINGANPQKLEALPYFSFEDDIYDMAILILDLCEMPIIALEPFLKREKIKNKEYKIPNNFPNPLIDLFKYCANYSFKNKNLKAFQLNEENFYVLKHMKLKIIHGRSFCFRKDALK